MAGTKKTLEAVIKIVDEMNAQEAECRNVRNTLESLLVMMQSSPYPVSSRLNAAKKTLEELKTARPFTISASISLSNAIKAAADGALKSKAYEQQRAVGGKSPLGTHRIAQLPELPPMPPLHIEKGARHEKRNEAKRPGLHETLAERRKRIAGNDDDEW